MSNALTRATQFEAVAVAGAKFAIVIGSTTFDGNGIWLAVEIPTVVGIVSSGTGGKGVTRTTG